MSDVEELWLPAKLLGKVVAPLAVQLPNFAETVDQLIATNALATQADLRDADRLDVHREAVVCFGYSPVALLEAITNRPKHSVCLIKDLSQTGLAILFDQMAYPSEEMLIYLNGREIKTRVKRCVKLGKQCFEIGALVLSVETVDE